MRLFEIVKARISHPEDLVWQYGADGAEAALSALDHIASDVNSLSVKWDGSPALIIGRDSDGALMVTDKSGFNAKGYDGRCKSEEALYGMLAGRSGGSDRASFALTISTLWNKFDQMIPKDLVGYFQGDLMFVDQPDLIDGHYSFTPNKIRYDVAANSEYGKLILGSTCGIAMHSQFKSDSHAVSPLTDISIFDNVPGLCVFSTEMMHNPEINIDIPDITNIHHIADLLDEKSLRSRKITDLGALFGKYIAGLARQGSNQYHDAPNGFIIWLDSAKISDSKKQNVRDYIQIKQTEYNATWEAIRLIADLKTAVKNQIDTDEHQPIKASFAGKSGHEGYVAVTPYGVIKLVDRHHFMKESK
jgi:hypothetical protein